MWGTGQLQPNPKTVGNHQIMKKILIPILLAGGLLSADATLFQYSVNLTPVPGGTGSGTGTANYDDVTHSLQLQVSWSGLSGNTTVSHIHGPTATPFTGSAGVVLTPGTLPGFPVGVTSGSYSTTLDLTQASTYPAAYITANGGTTAGAEAAITAAIAQGRTYWNIHTSTFGGGEINGFLTAIPEPSSLAILTVGGLLALRGRKIGSAKRA